MKISKIHLAMAAAMAVAFGASAQSVERTLRIYQDGNVGWEKNVQQMDSIKFDGGNALFHYGGSGVKVKSLQSIDSVVFAATGSSTLSADTVAVPTDSVVLITFGESSVSVINPFEQSGVSVVVDGTDVSVSAAANRADIVYRVSGSCADGSLQIQTDRKLIVVLDALTLTNPDGPALKLLGDKRTALHLVGVSTLADGTSSGGKGAVQSDGRFEVQGTGGTLRLYGYAKHGLQSSGATSMLGGSIEVMSAAKDGLNVDNFVMYGGSITVGGTEGDCIDADQGYIYIAGGELNLTSSADGAKGLACDSSLTIAGGDISISLTGSDTKGLRAGGTLYIAGGRLNISTLGSSSVYTNASGELDSYKPIAIKAKSDLRWTAGRIAVSTTGHGLSADGLLVLQASATDSLTVNSSGNGFTYSGSGSSATDGFAPACLKSDSNIVVLGGTIEAIATGTGGRGVVADGRLMVGQLGAADSLLRLAVKTSGSPVNASSSSGGGGNPWGGGGNPWGGWGGGSSDYWKGLPKGIKIKGNIVINSGIVQSYCAQTGSNSGGGWGGGGGRSANGEAIESKDSIVINGGVVETNAYDDAINANNYIEINGGQVWAYSRGNDAIDCNGTVMRFNGGQIVVVGSECGVDNNQEQGGVLYVAGATVVIVPGSMGAIESTCTVTGQKKLQLSSTNFSTTNGFAIYNSSSEFMLAYKQPSVSGSGFLFANEPKASGQIFITSPDIQSGTYKVFRSPSLAGEQFHGLYLDDTDITTSGSGNSVTAQ